MEETWEFLFKSQSEEDGHTERYIEECLDYGKHLLSKNLPIIFDTDHLALLLNLTTDELKYITDNSVRMYRTFDLEKSDNKSKRTINAPFPRLKFIQQWINVNILCRDKNILPCCQAFMPQDLLGKRDIKTNALPHVGCKWLLNMDLKNFFPNITYKQVYAYFYQLGYIEEVARALSQLCCKDFRVPQGAPSSPMLANHIARSMDEDIQAYCKSHGFIYTRYADDITISGNEYVDAKSLINDMEAIIFKNDFWVNRKKTKFRVRGNRQSVTGLTIDHGVHVPKSYRKDILKELHCCLKFGPTKHIAFRDQKRREKMKSKGIADEKIKDLGFYRQWLLGRIMYVRSIEPETGKKMLEQYNQIHWIL